MDSAEKHGNEILRQEYGEKSHLFGILCREAARQIDELLSREHIALALPIEHRVKSIDSILEKGRRLGRQFSALSEMRDVAGLRLVLLFRRDVDRVVELVSEHFDVLIVEDAQARLEADRFGYASIHMEVRPRPEWLMVPSWKPLEGLSAEIQVRTASQHIWAAASHILQYKRESHVPLPMRRAINRVAALLELVDLELDRVLTERQGYRETLSAASLEGHDTLSDLPLDIEVLRRILNHELPSKNWDPDDEDDLALLLDACINNGVTTETRLVQLLRKHAEALRAEDATMVKDFIRSPHPGGDRARAARGVYFTHGGLVRQALTLEFGESWRRAKRDQLWQ